MSVLVRYRWWALVGVFLLTGTVLGGLEKAVVPDNSMGVWFLETDPALEQYRTFQDRFGNDELVLIHMQYPDGVYTAKALGQMRTLGEKLAAIDGVQRVYSVAHTPTVTLSLKGPLLTQAIPSDLRDPATIEKAVAPLRDSPLIQGVFVDETEKQAMMWVEMVVSEDFDARRDSIIAAVREATAEELGEQPHHFAGIGVLYTGLNQVTEADFGTFLGLGYLLLFAAMAWVFRSVVFTVAAMLVVGIGTVVMFGVYGLMGNQLNMVTSVLPIVVMVLAVADVVHFPAAFIRYRRADPTGDKREAAVAALRDVLWPCVLTTVTTMAGFLALTSAPMAVVRHLGLYTAIGVATALVASVILMAVAFLLVGDKTPMPKHRGIERFVAGCRNILAERSPLMLACSLVIVVAATVGATRLNVDTMTLKYLPSDHPVVADHEAIETAWGPYNVLEFVVHPAEGKTLNDADLLAAMGRFVDKAVDDPRIHKGLSLDTVYRAFLPDAQPGTPLTQEQIALLSWGEDKLNLVWEPEKQGFRNNAMAAFRTSDASLGRIKLVGSMLSARELSALQADMDALGQQTMGDLGTIEASGYLPLYTRIIDYVMTSQIRSFLLAMALIFGIMLLGLRSLRLALISLIPNVFPVTVMFAVMGFAGIDLDIGTASIAAIVLGVSIDDTIHFLWSWRHAERNGMGWHDALAYTLDHAGRPAIITTVLLVCGYSVLMAGSGATVFYFGLLTTVAAVAALFADLIILPLLLKPFTRPVTS